MSDDPLKAAHRRCIRHRIELERSAVCACFYCLERFPPGEVAKWIDGGETALCPRCGVDAVLGDASGLSLVDAFLAAMHARWFGSAGESP